MAASSRSERERAYLIYGVLLSTRLQLAELDTEHRTDPPGCPVVSLKLTTDETLTESFSGHGRLRARLSSADGPVEVVVGQDEDLLLRSDIHGDVHISPDGAYVQCAQAQPESRHWRRFLLDTALGAAALRRGMVGLHACAVKTDNGVIAITAPTGGGKTTVATELLRHEAELFSDDLLFLTRERNCVLAHPGPPMVKMPDGRWVKVSRARPGPSRLAALVVLDRGMQDRAPALEPASPDLLLHCSLDGGQTPERRMRRFAMLADLAQQTPLLRLSASRAASAEQLAVLIRSRMEAGAS